MLNYMAADLSRIFKRKSHIILMLITFAVFCAAIAISVSVLDVINDPAFQEAGFYVETNDGTMAQVIRHVAAYAAGIIGLFELIAVFSDDLKAKTAQIAIGVGVSRVKVVLSKFFELLILLVIDMVIMMALGVLMSRLKGSILSVEQLFGLCKEVSVNMLLSNAAYASLVFILLFTTQSMTQSIICFLALNFGIVSGAIGLLGNMKALRDLNLSSYTLSSMLDRIKAMINGAAFDIVPYAAAFVYLLVALAITILLYRKKELEF